MPAEGEPGTGPGDPLPPVPSQGGRKDVALRVDRQIMNLGQGGLIDHKGLSLGGDAINQAVRHAARQQIALGSQDSGT